MTGTAVLSLGTFQLNVGGRPVSAWRAGGSRAVFQFLLANRGLTISRETLGAVVWPDRCDNRVGNSLSVALHALRRILDAGGDLMLVRDGDGYRLCERVDGQVRVDTEELAALARTARSARRSGHLTAEIAAAERSAEVYGGEFLPGEGADWVVAHRAWVTSLVTRTLHDACTSAMQAHRFDDAMRLCWQTLRVDECDESSYQSLMWMHGRLGERSRVVSWFGLCADRLLDRLDVEPAPLTHRLLEAGMWGSDSTGPDVPRAALLGTG